MYSIKVKTIVTTKPFSFNRVQSTSRPSPLFYISLFCIEYQDCKKLFCLQFFLHTLQICWCRLFRYLTKEEIFTIAESLCKKIPDDKTVNLDVIDHIILSQYYEDIMHKDNPNKTYLNPDLTIHKIYLNMQKM